MNKIASLGLTGLLFAGGMSSQAAAQDFDNPTLGDVACIAISHFTSERRGEGSSASTTLENVCGMPMIVNYCLTQVGEETIGICEELSMRPNETRKLRQKAEAGRLIGPAIEWRHLTM